jgi:hypothetical protein
MQQQQNPVFGNQMHSQPQSNGQQGTKMNLPPPPPETGINYKNLIISIINPL